MFQTLPFLVIDNTIQYLITYNAASSVCDTDSYDSPKNLQYLYSLTHTCHGWRDVAKIYLCKKFVLRFNGLTGELVLCTPCVSLPTFFFEPYAKTLDIQIQYSYILKGDFTENQVVFPNVQRLDINIDFSLWSSLTYAAVPKSKRNQAFTQFLQRLVPKVSEVRFYF